MFDFAEMTKDMTAKEILNYYRYIYYAEPQVTERGIIANAIKDYFADVVQKSEVEEMTDDDIIKALECCGINQDCKGCYFDVHEAGDICAREVVKNAFDLINRQQEEIERLKKRQTREEAEKALEGR